MSDTRFRPSFKASNEGDTQNQQRVSPRVPVNHPVPRNTGRRTVNSSMNNVNNSYEEPQQRSSYSGGMRPPMEDIQREYMEEKQVKKSKGALKKVLITLGVLVVIVGLVLGAAYLGSNGSIPFIDTGEIANKTETNTTTDAQSSLLKNTTSEFTGEPVPVKWPSDIVPTRMELQFDPVTGEQYILLVGDKNGLGTVIRSYDASGVLKGFWVVVPDEPALSNSTNNTNNTTNNTTNNNSNNATTTELTEEQKLANDVHAIIKGQVDGKTAEQLTTEYKDKLTPIAEKYKITEQQAVEKYLSILEQLAKAAQQNQQNGN